MAEYKIAWVIPLPTAGSGGLRTIFSNARALEKQGCACKFFIIADDYESVFDEDVIRSNIEEWFSYKADIELAVSIPSTFDAVIATFWKTARFASLQPVKDKFYFIQDYEPWFYPMGDDHLEAQMSYRLGLVPITIGKWLARKISEASDEPDVSHCDFGADLTIYHPIEPQPAKENAICAILQPGKHWRLPHFVQQALYIISILRPDVTIYTYGSNAFPEILKRDNIIDLGIISPPELNKLYNSCLCGICLSCSNPSRIPFEMMAAGLPVIELSGENTSLDLPNDAVIFTDRTPEALARTTIDLLDSPQKRESLAQCGMSYMAHYPKEVETSVFANTILKHISMQHEQRAYGTCQDTYQMLATEEYARRYDLLLEGCTPLRARNVSLRAHNIGDSPDHLKVYAWSMQGQEDMQISLLEEDGEATYAGSLALPACDSLTRVHFHIYEIDSEGREVFFAGFDREIDNSNPCSRAWHESIYSNPTILKIDGT